MKNIVKFVVYSQFDISISLSLELPLIVSKLVRMPSVTSNKKDGNSGGEGAIRISNSAEKWNTL